jgi:hypothetical protein
MAISALASLGLGSAPLFAASWLLYLSLFLPGQTFLSFQWDILLLEAGFVTIFMAPWRLLTTTGYQHV